MRVVAALALALLILPLRAQLSGSVWPCQSGAWPGHIPLDLTGWNVPTGVQHPQYTGSGWLSDEDGFWYAYGFNMVSGLIKVAPDRYRVDGRRQGDLPRGF
jgi:hypothetical protein